VAKRTRGVTPTSAYRPGQAPARRTSATASSAKPGTQPVAATPAAAPVPNQLDAAIVRADSAAVATQSVPAATPRAQVTSRQRGHVKMKPNSLLAARAAQEYVYVGEDLRHIAIVGSSMFVVLILLWLVVVVANVFGLY
jgi:hypothetical protein